MIQTSNRAALYARFSSDNQRSEISSVQQAAEIYAPNGENIASYNSLGGGWTDIQTKEEHKFFDETASIYLQAFREARTEMKSSQPAPSVETSVNIRA